MRRKAMPLAVLTLAASLALGAAYASGGTAVHVFWPASQVKAAFVNVNGRGLKLGDRIAAHGPLNDPATGKSVGSAYGECWVGRPLVNNRGLYVCTYVLKLTDGTITLQGLDPHGNGSPPFAVTGGSGAYDDARGDAVFTDSDQGTDMEIRLLTA